MNVSLGRLADALADEKRADRTAGILIAGYVLVWWLYAVIAKSSQDIHFDMGEVVSWSLIPAFGYAKHPPFPAWVASTWFSIFPYTDWAYYLLATASIGVALWFVWLIAARYVDGHKRVLALTFLTFSPGFNLQPLKFNSNALLIPVWAAASYLFLRAFTERSPLWGALAGAGAAIAMLTKYWSVFLVLGFIVAALADHRRWDYLRSPAPWASIIVGALILTPNIVSLLDHDFQPFRYATISHAVPSLRALLGSFSDYFGGVLYLAGGFLALAIACRPGPSSWRDALVPSEPDRRLMMLATWTMLLAPLLLALALRTRLSMLWTFPMWAMVPAAVLSSRAIAVTRSAAAGSLLAAIAAPVAAVLLSPVIAYVIHVQGLPNSATHHGLIAAAVDEAWKNRTAAPLKLFGSTTNIASGAGFYLPSQPLRIDILRRSDTPWADDARIGRDGMAIVCPETQPGCMEQLNALAAALPHHAVILARSYWGVAGAPERYIIVILPPR